MNKFTLFSTILILCVAYISLTSSLNAQEFSNNRLVDNEGSQVENNEKSPLDLENLPEDSYYPGKIKVKFHSIMEKNLDGSVLSGVDNNHVKTGISDLDRFNESYKVHTYEPVLKELYELSPASRNYKERHREWGFHLLYRFKLDENADIIKAITELEKLEEVKLAEPLMKMVLVEPVESGSIDEINRKDAVKDYPNDPFFHPNQWGFKNTGQLINNIPGTEGMDTNASAAWEIEKGDSNVVVAIFDTGVDYKHEDLAGNMWPEIGILGENTNPDSHGTHVAGTVAAVSNNEIGVAGFAGGSGQDDGVRIMSIPNLDGVGTTPAYLYAADNGAAISQNSWSHPGAMPGYTANAIDYFVENGGGDALDGGIVFFSAGNNNTSTPNYPGAYEKTIAVASHCNRGYKSTFSNYGEWVDIIAPGQIIYSTTIGDNYAWNSGTSMSCPHASGAAALVISQAYGMLTNTQLEEIILNSANPDIYDLNPHFQGELGTGRLDALAALELLNTITFDIVDENGNEITEAVATLDSLENKPGNYEFKVYTAGETKTYEYKIEKEGFFTKEGEVEVEDEDVTVNITLIRANTVTFDVEDEWGNEIENAIITFDDEKYEPGKYVFEKIESGTYDYKVEKQEYFPFEGEVVVDDDVTVEVILEADGTYIDTPEDIEVSVFPNPARNKFNIESNEMIEKIKMIDLRGQVVKNIQVGSLNSEINVSKLQTGVYFMQIHTAENIINKRVQITR